MTTYFLIDGTNNNRVLNNFLNKDEAMDYINRKEHTENWDGDYETFEEFKDEFFLVDSEEMNEAVRVYGNRRLINWN